MMGSVCHDLILLLKPSTRVPADQPRSSTHHCNIGARPCVAWAYEMVQLLSRATQVERSSQLSVVVTNDLTTSDILDTRPHHTPHTFG